MSQDQKPKSKYVKGYWLWWVNTVVELHPGKEYDYKWLMHQYDRGVSPENAKIEKEEIVK